MTDFVLAPEQVSVAVEAVHAAGKDGRPIPTSGQQLASSHELLRKERDLVYGELNKALGSHAPKAWDRIKEQLTS